MHTTYSLHKISTTDDFGFKAADYSRFKFGDGDIAVNFGEALAIGFIKEHTDLLNTGHQLVVIPSPYSFIPTATFTLKNTFVSTLNRWLAKHNLPVVQENKVHRTITYKEDYGELNAEERLRLIGNDSFHIDKAFLKGKTLVFLDDIRITGGHERMIKKMIDAYELDNTVYMLYFAELVNDAIHPSIENYLNYFSVQTIFDLDDIINGGNFCINTRIVKYMLNYDHESFCVFLQNKSDAFINQFYDMALGNSYHTMESYRPNLNYLSNQLVSNNKKLA
ncbi:phosphoribosyltransferase family protein [Mucilaginibacter auburnensis]|uniref:Phosphoribosyl transferase-like protein n=1 Tax=Mucilaginibacter auburnensis TaxID=1457233 RepID=A0A2H9VQW4_9SPHI|nr:phosphoribosyltransferase family protein [Mucilaginibacter auburnensis]PJJ83211.1 phosphoribosyl transferase-like protein [Mucilaginibacter auburnensis]